MPRCSKRVQSQQVERLLADAALSGWALGSPEFVQGLQQQTPRRITQVQAWQATQDARRKLKAFYACLFGAFYYVPNKCKHLQQHGLYSSGNEHDACGLALPPIKGVKRHDIVTQALEDP